MMYHLGTAFYYKSFYQEARELFRSALGMNSEHHQAFNQLGLTELALGDVNAAIKAATQAVTRRPRFADYRNNLGEAYMAEGDVRGAIAQFQEAINVNLYYADAYFNLGIAYLQDAINRPDASESQALAAKVNDCLHKASLIYPGYRGSQFDAGLAEIKERRNDRALRTFRAIRDAKKESHKQEFAGFYLKFILFPEWVSEKVIQERISFLQQEIAKNPTYVDLQVDLAHCFLEQSRMAWQKGIEHYQRSTEMNPSLTKAQSALDHVERVYQQMCGAIGRISEKG
jgi:tetratricopeptide (TPR) repeat protein